MSYAIYTIAHPITDEIVYVGCTKDLQLRIRSHVNCKTRLHEIQNYILNLRNNFLYPKIELLEEVADGENPFEAETFWINQLKFFGFNLINKNKTIPTKKVYYEKKKFKVVDGNRIERTSRKWDKSLFFVGNVFELGNTTQQVFTATFKNYCRKFGFKLYLKYSEDKSTATVVDVKPLKEKYVPKFIWPKGKDRKPLTNSIAHLLDPLRVVGGSVEIKPSTNFASLKTLISYHLKDIKSKRMNYFELGNGIYKIIRVR